MVAPLFNIRPAYIGNWREDALAKPGMVQRGIEYMQARFDALVERKVKSSIAMARPPAQRVTDDLLPEMMGPMCRLSALNL